MAQIRLPLIIGTTGVAVAHPSYSMVPGTHLPITPGKIGPDGVMAGVPIGDPSLATATVLVNVPDDEVMPDGKSLNIAIIKQKYPSHWLVTSGTIK